MSILVGIDLGTTNSVVACRNVYGRPEIVPNRDGAPLTPSVLYFGTDPPAVGHEAREYARLGDELVASFFKPHMGNPLYRLHFGGRDYDATDLSALVLRRLKEDAESALDQPVEHAVITVPAYFADAQRKATLAAGEAAGLHVLRILNEPTAAALAYGLQVERGDETVLIYDLGGGTFDVTIARVLPETVSVLATAGDHDLGGKNWDDRIATYLAERFAADTGLDPLDDPVALNEVLTLAERAKWQLSDRAATRITLQLGSKRQSYELSRDEFEGLTFPLMDRTRRLTEEALGESGLSWREMTAVLLVGGATRMPMVRRYVTEMSGQPPRPGVNVDEVVALGAAIQAAQEGDPGDSLKRIPGRQPGVSFSRFTLVGPRRVHDVMSHSLGVVAVSEDGGSYINDTIIRRNLPIPVENARSYLLATHGGRNDRLEVYLTQGEARSPLDCSILGRYVFKGIQATDVEVVVDVKLSYDANGVVQVRAVQRDTLKELAMTVEPVPDDLNWLGQSPEAAVARPADPVRVFLLIDVSASMSGEPLIHARMAAREFLDQCDFNSTEVGLIAFSDRAILHTEATDDPGKVLSGIARLEPGGTTNLTDALVLACDHLRSEDRTRYIVILTDGYPDAPRSAAERAEIARQGIEIVAIGTGNADRDYLKRLASTEAGSLFAKQGELVETFGHIARVIARGGRSLRTP